MTTTPAYQVCSGCDTTYATVGELFDQHSVYGLHPLDMRQVSFCPKCLHDFRDRPVTGIAGDLPAHAAVLVDAFRRNGFDPARGVERNMVKLGEETGELMGAWLRATGQARRSGPMRDVHLELADVLLTGFVLAHELGIDINAVLTAKLHTIHTRGWREAATPSCDGPGVPCVGCPSCQPDIDDEGRDAA